MRGLNATHTWGGAGAHTQTRMIGGDHEGGGHAVLSQTVSSFGFFSFTLQSLDASTATIHFLNHSAVTRKDNQLTVQ